jgi:circadian clock protein KaiB
VRTDADPWYWDGSAQIVRKRGEAMAAARRLLLPDRSGTGDTIGSPKSRIKSDDMTRAFERALAAQLPAERYLPRRFVTGSTPRSTRAIENIRAICEEKLQDRYDLEVIDVYKHPEQLKSAQIVAAPTPVKSLPLPVRRIIGDLSDKERVLVGLDIVPRQS